MLKSHEAIQLIFRQYKLPELTRIKSTSEYHQLNYNIYL